MWMLVNVLSRYAHVTWSKYNKGQSLCVKKTPSAIHVVFLLQCIQRKMQTFGSLIFFLSQKILSKR